MSFTHITKIASGAVVPKSGYLDEVVDDLDAIWGIVTAPPVNNSGGTLANGDVVVFETGVANSVTTSTTVGDSRVVGVAVVASGTVANEASVDVQTAGRIAVVNVTGTVNVMDRLQVSGTAKRAQAGTVNTFAVALTANPSGTGWVVALLKGPGAGDRLGVPAVSLRNSANISLADNTLVLLTFDTEFHDTDSMHSTVSNTGRITFTTGGLYLVSGICGFTANSTGYRTILFRANGDGVNRGVNQVAAITSADSTICYGAFTRVFAAGDYVEMYAIQNSGSTLNALAANNYGPGFGATYLGSGT